MAAKISSISLTCYGAHPTANITVTDHDPFMSMTFSLTDNEAIELQAFAANIVARRKTDFVKQVESVDPTPLLAVKTSDLISKASVIEATKIIEETPRVADPDDDDIPF